MSWTAVLGHALFLPLRLVFKFYFWMGYRKRRLFYEPVKEILLIEMGAAGRVLMVTPLIESVKRRFQKSRLTVMASPRAIEVLDASPWVDDVIVHDPSWLSPDFSFTHKLGDCWSTARYFRDKPFDLVISASDQTLYDSLLLSLIPAKFRAGFDVGGGGFALTHPARARRGLHRVEKNLALAAVLGGNGANPKPTLRTKMEDEKITGAFLEDKGLDPAKDLMVAMHPGASAVSRQWGADRFTETARLLVKAGAKVLLFGGLAERETALAMKREIPEVINLSGKTGIRQMASLMARCRVFVGNDAGPGHVAAAMRIPCVIAFAEAGSSGDRAPYGVPSVALAKPANPAEVVEAALRLAKLPSQL